MWVSLRGAVTLSLAVFIATSAGTADEAPIRILHISRAGSWRGLMDQDPAISTFWIPVPGHSHIELLGQDPGVLQRIMRMYMPRRVEDLLDDYNMIILHECPYSSTAHESLWFKDTWVSMFVEAIEVHGMTLEMWGGDASFGGRGEGSYTSWEDTMLGPLLPVKCLGGYNYQMATPQRVEFVDSDNPLARLPWGECPPIELNNAVQIREGGHLVANVVHGQVKWPYIFDWEYGNGFVVGETQVVHSLDTLNLMIAFWEYFPDFVTYMAYYGVGRSIPEDVLMVKRIRNDIQSHYAERSMVISVIDFAEKFGADVAEAYDDIKMIDEAYREVEDLFLKEDYQGASDVLENIGSMWSSVAGKAVELKDKALMWVYIVEYLAVVSVALVSGFVLWSLMIRRRLFREVSETRMSSGG